MPQQQKSSKKSTYTKFNFMPNSDYEDFSAKRKAEVKPPKRSYMHVRGIKQISHESKSKS